MSCNAIAMIQAKLAQAESLDEAIKELTLEQAKALFTALLIEGTKFNQGNVRIYGSPFATYIDCGSLRVTIKTTADAEHKIQKAEIEDRFQDFTPEELNAKIARFNAQTIKAAGLIKQAEAIKKITQAYAQASTMTAPNGAKIITLNL